MPLTDTVCKASKPKDKDYKLTDANGLYLHVMPTGARYWRYKYRYLGKQKVFPLLVCNFYCVAIANALNLNLNLNITHNGR